MSTKKDIALAAIAEDEAEKPINTKDWQGYPLLGVPYQGIKFDMYEEFHQKYPELPASVFEWYYWNADKITDEDLDNLRAYLVSNDILKDNPELCRGVEDLHFPEDPDTIVYEKEAKEAQEKGDSSLLEIFNQDLMAAKFIEDSLDNLLLLANSAFAD